VAIAILTQYIPVEILGQDLERINQCELQLWISNHIAGWKNIGAYKVGVKGRKFYSFVIYTGLSFPLPSKLKIFR
jgi:hypothetical protein